MKFSEKKPYTNEVKFLLFLAIGSYASALAEYISEKPINLWSGKWRWLYNWSIATFNENEPVILWLIFSTFCFVSAYF